ncbi:hypothetical protein JVT61DRAFT_9248 [Boletus reticuloceps]|uniref:Uncharacterized protein n=1 Tax=Boletus reticuloceps TaxID=495285 RepID=A0A8I2YGZ9_9AGAM|nr:hypothetical protein JVT61DRAFT_9248 [Boletus reticuloceps]
MSAAFRISPALWDKIHHFVSFPQTGGQSSFHFRLAILVCDALLSLLPARSGIHRSQAAFCLGSAHSGYLSRVTFEHSPRTHSSPLRQQELL